MQEIASLLHSTRELERRNGIKLLASYLQQTPMQAEMPVQVAALVGDILSEQNALVQQETLELLMQHFPKIKFVPGHLVSPLLDLFKSKKAAIRALVFSVLAKVLETNVYPPLDLIQKFFDSPVRGQKMAPSGVVDLLQVLCKVFPIHGETKRLFFNLLFNLNAVPVRISDNCITKFQQVVGTHLWGLEHQRKVRPVDIAETGVSFPVEGEIMPQFREFVTTLTQASTRSPLTPETMENILRKFPPFPLDRCFAPFFFIEVVSVTKRHVVGETYEFEITGILKCLLPVSFTLIGTEAATVSPTGLESTVNPSGEFHIHIQILKMYQNYIPFMFYVDILGKQVPMLMPFVMPRPGDPVLHDDLYAGEEKGVSITAGVNGEYMTAMCSACGQENAFRIAEIASSAPLYCKSCGVLLKRQGELHLI